LRTANDMIEIDGWGSSRVNLSCRDDGGGQRADGRHERERVTATGIATRQRRAPGAQGYRTRGHPAPAHREPCAAAATINPG